MFAYNVASRTPNKHEDVDKIYSHKYSTHLLELTCKRGSVSQSEGLLIPRSSIRFHLKPRTQIHMDLSY